MSIKTYNQDLRKQKKSAKESYLATPEDKAGHEFFISRRAELKQHRENSGIEEIWRAADKAYEPHKIKATKGKKVLVSDDELGWRSQEQILDKEGNWQEDSVPPNPYVKIQTALGIIVDRNPAAVLKPGKKKYENNTLLYKNLYERSWDIAHSKSAMLKPMVFNMAKYGLGVGRTYPYCIKRTVSDIVDFEEGSKKPIYKAEEMVYYDDVFRESLTPWQVWFDDGAVIGNPFSCEDVMWYKDYSWDKFKEQFGDLPNFKYIVPKKQSLAPVEGEINKTGQTETATITKYSIRIWFYESLTKDAFYVETDDGITLVNTPIPRKKKNKRLSLYYAVWTMRDDKSIFGIGVYEAMRNDHKLYLKVRNMTMDQLVLSIYKEWFYEGTNSLEGDGTMRIRPGKGRQVVNPQNMKWNEIPGPGKEAWASLDFLEKKMEESSGISRTLQGEIVGNTAYETAQAREGALKRLKTPLENLTEALEMEAYISIGIIEDLYSTPKIRLIAEDRYVDAFELEDLRDPESGDMPEHEIEYREVPMNLERDKDGKMSQSDKESFFTMKEEDFPWEGVISIKGQSIIATSELIERQTTLEMANLIIPLLTSPVEIVGKTVKEIIKLYDKDPQDWLPDTWLNPEQNSLFTKIAQGGAGGEEVPPGGGGAETVIPPSDISGPMGPGEKLNNSLNRA